jgi:hypothetical protein
MNAVDQVHLLFLVKEASRVASVVAQKPYKVVHKSAASSRPTPSKEVSSGTSVPSREKEKFQDKVVVTKSEAKESGKPALGVSSRPSTDLTPTSSIGTRNPTDVNSNAASYL